MRRQPLPSGFDPPAALHLLGSPVGQLQRPSTSLLGKMFRKEAGLRQEELHMGGDRNRNERFQRVLPASTVKPTLSEQR